MLLFLLASASACAREAGQQPDDEHVYIPIPVPLISDRTPKPSRIIYLNREGATLYAGADEASANRSGIVSSAHLESFDVPAFRGTPRQWDDMVTCLRDQFAAYDVSIVEQRPLVPGYVMAVVGGEPGRLADGVAHQHGVLTGLAPFNGQPVENAVVLIFSRTLRERPRATCETAAMEIAHAYGLDHAMHCGDVMSYLRPCGRRRFSDRAVPCGEHEARACGDGEATQNSHRRLLEVLGPARTPERP